MQQLFSSLHTVKIRGQYEGHADEALFNLIPTGVRTLEFYVYLKPEDYEADSNDEQAKKVWNMFCRVQEPLQDLENVMLRLPPGLDSKTRRQAYGLLHQVLGTAH